LRDKPGVAALSVQVVDKKEFRMISQGRVGDSKICAFVIEEDEVPDVEPGLHSTFSRKKLDPGGIA